VLPSHPRHDSEVADNAAIQQPKSCLICSTVVNRNGLLDRVEFDENRALEPAILVRIRGNGAGQETATARLDCGPCKSRVRSQLGRVRDLTIAGDPIGFSHGYPFIATFRWHLHRSQAISSERQLYLGITLAGTTVFGQWTKGCLAGAISVMSALPYWVCSAGRDYLHGSGVEAK